MIKVPEGMLRAAMVNGFYPGHLTSPGQEQRVEDIIKSALEWLSENPIVPTLEQWADCLKEYSYGIVGERMGANACAEWQRRMFLEPEPMIPEEVKELLVESSPSITVTSDWINGRILEAFRRRQAK